MQVEIDVPGKICTACKHDLPLSQFRPKTSGNGLRGACRDCEADIRRVGKLKTRYDIDENEFFLLWESQEGRCAICNNTFKSASDAHIDHCHTQGYVRGILCQTCNMGLGMFKDNPQFLLRAVRYLGSIDQL